METFVNLEGLLVIQELWVIEYINRIYILCIFFVEEYMGDCNNRISDVLVYAMPIQCGNKWGYKWIGFCYGKRFSVIANPCEENIILDKENGVYVFGDKEQEELLPVEIRKIMYSSPLSNRFFSMRVEKEKSFEIIMRLIESGYDVQNDIVCHATKNSPYQVCEVKTGNVLVEMKENGIVNWVDNKMADLKEKKEDRDKKMHSIFPKCENAEEIIAYLKNRSTAEAMRNERRYFPFTDRQISILSEKYPTLFDLHLLEKEKIQGVGRETLHKVWVSLKRICEELKPDYIVAYKNKYFTIFIDKVAIDIWGKGDVVNVYLLNDYPVAHGVKIQSKGTEKWLHKGINKVCTDASFIVNAGKKMEVSYSVQYLGENKKIANDICVSVNVLFDEFIEVAKKRKRVSEDIEIKIDTNDMPEESVRNINYYRKLKTMLKEKYPLLKRDTHLIMSAYRCNIPHMIEDVEEINQNLIYDIIEKLDVEYGISEKYSIEIIKFFSSVYQKNICGKLENRSLEENDAYEDAIKNVIRRIFQTRKVSFEKIGRIWKEYSIEFSNEYEVNFKEINFKIALLQNNVVVEHQHIRLEHFIHRRSEKVKLLLNEHMDKMELESFDYELDV